MGRVWFICPHEWLFTVNVGKYTVRPMDPTGDVMRGDNSACFFYFFSWPFFAWRILV